MCVSLCVCVCVCVCDVRRYGTYDTDDMFVCMTSTLCMARTFVIKSKASMHSEQGKEELLPLMLLVATI